ncbi:MAG: SRPBCC family protein [Rhodocyclaceae bacterium]
MKFEHLIEINSPGNPLIPALTRNQLWQGLMIRAEDATFFLPGLDTCTVIERHGRKLQRCLDFGTATIHDTVTWMELEWVCFDVAATESHAGGRLTISIEEPEADHLFLRFAYATTLGENPGDENAGYADFVKSAYHESDIETVRVIRMLLAEAQSH